MVDALLAPSPSSNCTDDVDRLLFSLGKRSSKVPALSSDNDAAAICSPDLLLPAAVKSRLTVGEPRPTTSENKVLTSQKDNILTYIAGYICRKVKSKVCSVCVEALIGTPDQKNDEHLLLMNKNYSEAKCGLVVPSSQFLAVVKSMEARYCEVVSNAVLSSRVRMQIVTQLRDLPSMHYLIHRDVCKCNLVCPIVNLFVTMRLHHTLMMNSRYFPTCKTGRNRKCIKFSHV